MNQELKPCRYCDGAPKVDMLRVICTRCSAHTRDFTATLGEFQREQAAAIGAWERGEYKVHPDAIEFARRVLAEVEQSDIATQAQSQDTREALDYIESELQTVGFGRPTYCMLCSEEHPNHRPDCAIATLKTAVDHIADASKMAPQAQDAERLAHEKRPRGINAAVDRGDLPLGDGIDAALQAKEQQHE